MNVRLVAVQPGVSASERRLLAEVVGLVGVVEETRPTGARGPEWLVRYERDGIEALVWLFPERDTLEVVG